MAVRLTETAIRKVMKESATDTKRRELADAGCAGLRLRVTPAGAASWVLGCRDRQGRARRFPLGSFPAVGISAARDGARELRTKVMAGADPIADRRRERAQAEAAKNGDGTLRALLDLYGHKRGTGLRSWEHSRKRVDRVFAGLLARPVANLTTSDLQMKADDYAAGASASFAVRTLRPVLKWAAQRGIADPKLADIRAPEPVKRRKRVLSESELAALLPVLRAAEDAHAAALRFVALAGKTDVSGLHWRQIDLQAGTLTHRNKAAAKVTVLARKLPAAAIEVLRNLPAGAPGESVFLNTKAHAAAIRFMLLTLARREEAAGACWGEIDLLAGTWTIPGERTKNAEPHTVPLSRQAIALLRNLGPDAANAPVFRNASGSLIGNWDRETKALQEASGTGGWTRHDLRRTGATLLGEMGELPDIIEAALNHVAIRSPLAAIYNRSRYRPQVAAALQRLADRLDGIEHGGSLVVPLRRA